MLQYGNSGSVEQHGFARNIIWTIEDDPPSLKSFDTQGQSFIDLLLKLSEDELKFSPHVYDLHFVANSYWFFLEVWVTE